MVTVIVFRKTAKESRTIILSTAIQKLAPLTFFFLSEHSRAGRGKSRMNSSRNDEEHPLV